MSPDITDTVSVRGDEYFTMRITVEQISDQLAEKFLYKPLKIWCPFDTDQSYFPIVLRERGFDVVNTSTDFFQTDPPDGCNCIVSNPPFSRKKDILKRCKDLNMPFALLLPFLFLNDGVPLDYGHQIVLFRKRVHFVLDGTGELNKPRTNCFVLSNGLLKNDFTIVR